MANKKFSDFADNPDTVLTTPAPSDLVLIWDNSEPLDINRVKVITFQNLVNLAAQSALQALVSGQTAGDTFYAYSATALARLAKGTAGQSLIQGTFAPYWGDQRTIKSTQVAGDIFYATAPDALARLAKGTAGQVLRVNSGATAPEWGKELGAVCIAKRSGYQTFSSSGTLEESVVNLNAEDEDAPGWHSLTTNNSRITVDRDALYLVIGNIQWEGNTSGARSLVIKKNGSNIINDRKQAMSASSAFANFLNASVIVRLSASDYVELYAAQSSGVDLDLQAAYLEVLLIGE